MTLPGGYRIRVHVHDATGRPVSGAVVSWPASRELPPLPSDVHLVLDGAREVSVHAVDSSGRPVANVLLMPWTLKKSGKLAYLNCSGSRTTLARPGSTSCGASNPPAAG